MEFKLRQDIQKIYDTNEEKLTLFCDENDNQLVSISDTAAKFFNDLENDKVYKLNDCVEQFCKEYDVFSKDEVEKLFKDVIHSLKETNFLG